jgi:RNA polymerase sigma-70 factor, ECF subfamily
MDGREAAFPEVFDEHHAALFRFAYRLTGSVADAEDIVQECFLGLLRPACSYDPKRASVRTYLFGAVRNQWLKRRPKDDMPVEVATSDLSPERAALRTELKDVVARAVLELPETQREVLILAHYEHMPLGEIAQIMALELGAVKSRLQRARATLKEALAAYAPSPERKV